MMMKRTFGILATLLFAASVMAGCSKGAKDAEKGGREARADKPVEVAAVTVEGRPVIRTVEAHGTIFPWDEVAVGSETAGTVKEIKADLGDSVAAGDVLAVFDDRETRLKLNEAAAARDTDRKTLEKERARLSDSRADFERMSALYKDGMASGSQYDNAKAEYEVSLAQQKEAEARVKSSGARLELARKHLSDTVIKAPISGEVKKRFVSAGETVKEKTTLFSIVSAESARRLKFRGTVPETSVPSLKQGQEAVISIEAFGEKGFKGTLKRLSPEVSPQTRTLEVEITVANPGGVLKPGFFARALISASKEENVPFVPEAAVYSYAGVTKVFVISDGKASERVIKTGIREGGLVEVSGDVRPGDTLASSNLSVIYEGAKVNVKSGPAPSPKSPAHPAAPVATIP